MKIEPTTNTSLVGKTAVILACVMAGATLLLAGCETPKISPPVKQSKVCPNCNTEMWPVGYGWAGYDKHICDYCKEVTIIDAEHPNIWVPETVHVCARCEAMVSTCPICIEQSGAVPADATKGSTR